ncbi:cell division protein FtsI (penicillin-binding protein 3) [Neisseria sp. HSC-16F19]|nr:penicillin-binding protein 2 [Neisseria sp. HSC-16F19]MCP2041939.1 cell division protein FtsI (penicillin-binding protein 3) [Neisseria sp. HSC-16F19]
MLIKNDYKPRMLPKQPKQKKPVTSNGRVMLVLGCFGLAFAGLIARSAYLQTDAEQTHLQSEGNKRAMRVLPLPAARGTITDRNGTPLAISAPADSLYAIPAGMIEMPSPQQLAELSAIIDVPVETLQDRLGRTNKHGKPKGFVYLKRQMTPEMRARVEELAIPGLAFQQENKRHYPMGNLFAHIIGFTNIDGKGQEGLELSREQQLQGQDGARTVLRDNKGNIVESVESAKNRAPVHGQDMVLSLDQRIQSLAYDELNKAMVHHQAKAGSVVVLDAQTGEILALVNAPSYDPNNPGAADSAHRRNRAVTDMLEPGSAMKPFPVAKALDAGKATVHTVLNTNPYQIGSATVRDTHNYGSLDLRGVLQKSSNVGTSRLSAMFKPEEMHSFYTSVGFGRRMHSGFPGESAGMVRNWKTWRPIEQATMSYGYGLQMSLLQLARSYTVLTNDGALLPVSFVKQDKAPQGEQVIKPETAKTVRKMMVSVTEKGGTGTAGAVEGFDVAAKTGTARKLVNGHYAENRHVATFIGFAPADKPRLIVAVNVDEPSVNGYYGGVVAGPVFKNIMSGSLNILGVVPAKHKHNKVIAAQ